MNSGYSYMDVVFLVYALAFFTLGLSIVLLNEHDSVFEISRLLWLLAAFAFIHGLLECMELWHLIHADSRTLALAQLVALPVSYLFLFEFGRRLVRASLFSLKEASLAGSLLRPWIYVPMLLGIVVGTVGSDQPLRALAIWSRYLPGFFGSCLAAAGFYLYCQNRIGADAETSDYPGSAAAWFSAAAAFVAYAILDGLVVPRADWISASIVNEESFFAALGIPIQLPRAICAIATAVSVARIMRIFNLDKARQLHYALDVEKMALCELYRIKPRYNAILDAAAEGVVGWDREGNVSFANGSALKMLGYERGELIGRPIQSIVRQGEPSGTSREGANFPIFLGAQTGATNLGKQAQFLRKNRTWFAASYRCAPFQQGNKADGAALAFRESADLNANE